MQLTKTYPLAGRETSVDLAFGSFFGSGLQALLAGIPLAEAVISSFSLWNIELDEVKSNKSIWTAIAALEQFSITKNLGELADYEVAIFNGKPALELSFCITLPNGFYYRGYVDCILRHKVTGQYLVVDIKTTGQNSSNPAKYQNSPQCLGYSVIMDKIDPVNSSYEVMYYEYMTYTKKFVAHHFMLSNLSRAQWLRNLLIDIDILKLYEEYEDWPMHGESCASYGRACQFIDVCTMATSSLCPPASYPFPDMHNIDAKLLDTKSGTDIDTKGLKVKKIVEYDVNVTFEELINSQLEKIS
jgi:hypothetical protein